MNRLQRDIKYNRLLREFGRYINMYCTLHTDTPGDAEELAVKVMEAVLGSIEGMHATSRWHAVDLAPLPSAQWHDEPRRGAGSRRHRRAGGGRQ